MKAKDIAKRYGVNHSALTNYICSQSGTLPQKRTLTDIEIDDGNVELLIVNFRQYTASAAGNEANRLASIEEEKLRKQTALASMLVTSGFNFDGFTITKYSGYISGDDVIQIERGKSGIFSSATNVGDSLMASLSQIRRNALVELKEAAYALGCNAVIGVDFDYLTLDPETTNGAWTAANARTVYLPYVFGVTANGNAVIIEKNKPVGQE